MKTKAEIVQRLLEAKQIDAEEAVVLLIQDKEVQFVPYPYNPLPYNPYPVYPLTPIWLVDPNSQPYYTNSFPNICADN